MKKRAGIILSSAVVAMALAPAAHAGWFQDIVTAVTKPIEDAVEFVTNIVEDVNEDLPSVIEDVTAVVTNPVESVNYALGLSSSIPVEINYEPISVNLIQNGSFEDGTSHWGGFGQKWSVNNTENQQGSSAAKFTTAGGKVYLKQAVALDAHADYEISACLKSESESVGPFLVSVLGINIEGGNGWGSMFLSTNDDTWRCFSGTFNSGTKTSTEVRVWGNSTFVGTGYVDNVVLRKTAALNGCDNITQIQASNPKNTEGKTTYPLVMVHGLSGFDNLMGVDYWYQIPKAMAEVGATVYVTQQSSVNSSVVRGDQLLSKIRCIIAMEDVEKVNLIGHSQGALDSRYVAGEAPELVASVTSVQGVNFGANFTRIYDMPFVDPDNAITQFFLSLGAAGARSLALWTGAAHYEQDGDALDSPESGTVMGDSTFNDKYPGGIGEYCKKDGDKVHNGIHYYSWGGTASFTNIFDPFTLLTSTLHNTWSLPYGEQSDGLVPRCSTHLGEVIKDNYYLDHIDGINHMLGLKGWRSPNPPSLYRMQAERLKDAGL